MRYKPVGSNPGTWPSLAECRRMERSKTNRVRHAARANSENSWFGLAWTGGKMKLSVVQHGSPPSLTPPHHRGHSCIQLAVRQRQL